MKIRVYGSPAEVAAATELLRGLFITWSVSRHYVNRDNSNPGTVRVYLHVDLPAGHGERP